MVGRDACLYNDKERKNLMKIYSFLLTFSSSAKVTTFTKIKKEQKERGEGE